MSIDTSRGYPVVHLGNGTVCTTTVLVDGVPGVAFSFACQQRKVGEEVGMFMPGAKLADECIGASIVFNNERGLDSFIHHIEECRVLLQQKGVQE
ncbi:hypothetical protein [Desulfovibrio psychrotolerans]|uniref:Uncharacterized protein n=1 Tax=Desulfovibrio psychrotolerans TaxID=415242 RepID=A0A7J0BY96_9BACT|nr:hypothetical protein [Desulfovibrio psychrotolerans]GFM37964.1 hypothetical protein DSM19430T_26480 [Desulfovibrio psychrotolerans]